MKVLYLATGVFDKGGISRYSRYQIRGLRERFGAGNVYVMSLLPCRGDVFEEAIEVQKTFSGPTMPGKVHYALQALWQSWRSRPDVVWANHVNLGPLAQMAARLAGGRFVVNIYGREMWSGLGGARAKALRRADHIVSDCHFTARWTQDNLGMSADRMTVIWDCVDCERFTPGEPDAAVAERYRVPLRDGRLRLMTLGRLETGQMHKGYHRLIRALSEAGGTLAADLVIGGDGRARGQAGGPDRDCR